MHWQNDLFCIVSFFPLWGGARLLYLHDPRSAAKLIEHLSFRFERYVPRVPWGVSRLNNAGWIVRRFLLLTVKMVRS